MKKSSNKNVKENNRALILSCLRCNAVSRADIVKLTGLSKASVTMITNDFILEGQLAEQEIKTSGNVGRPPVKIDIVPDYRFAAGFALHRNQLCAAIVNLKSKLVDCITVPTDSFKTPTAAINYLYDCLNTMCQKNCIDYKKLIGLGISCPGPINYCEGIILTPPELELFHGFNVKKHLSGLTDLPVFLDNNSVLLAISEDILRQNEYNNYMFVVASHGIGSAIVSEHNIYRGGYGYSGELGHMSIVHDGAACPCGNNGCLEQYVTMQKLKQKFGFDNYSTVVDKCLEGDKKSEKIIEYIAEMLSTAIVNAVNLMDLEAVVMYGDFNYKSEKLFSAISQKVNSRSIVSNAHNIEILPSKLPENANIICSTAAIIKAYFEQRL